MEKGNLIRKYEGLFERNYINEVIKKFEKIRELLFYKEDLNKTIDQYLNYDKIVCEFNTSIKNLLGDIRKVENLKFEHTWWERHFYPKPQIVLNDLYEKGLIFPGKYKIKIDW